MEKDSGEGILLPAASAAEINRRTYVVHGVVFFP
jgi:hypothetical protein